jgi:Cu2+-exporting ATPase
VAIDRPILPGRSDFFLVGDDLAPLRLALAAAHRLRRVVRSVLGISIVYNVLAVSTALSGRMSPVRAAIFMPLSSLSILLFTVFALRPRAPGAATDLRLLPAVEVAT